MLVRQARIDPIVNQGVSITIVRCINKTCNAVPIRMAQECP